MYPIIVLDGPDAAGKSTLAASLKDRYDARVIHMKYRFTKRMPQYMTAALNLALRLAEAGPVIIDRWWPSEITYARIHRGGSPWPLLGRFLHREALRHGLYYVWCLPQNKAKYLEHYTETKSRRDKDYLPGGRKANYGDTMGLIYDEYYNLLSRGPFRITADTLGSTPWGVVNYGNEVYDWTQWPDLQLWQQWQNNVIINAQGWRNRCEQPTIRITGNTVNPEVILVGERSNYKGRREVPPFFEYANSSLWLTKIIDDYGVREDDLAMVNPMKPDETPDPIVKRFLLDHPDAHIVAMGRAAELMLRTWGIECDTFLHHPQYYKRFRPDEGKVSLANVFVHTGLI